MRNFANVSRPKQLSALLKHEVDPIMSRGVGTLLAGNTTAIGTVLGKVTATDKLKPLDPAATDGSQNFFAVALDEADATAGDEQVLYVRRLARLSRSNLVWKAGTTDEQKAAVLVQADALFVLARDY